MGRSVYRLTTKAAAPSAKRPVPFRRTAALLCLVLWSGLCSAAAVGAVKLESSTPDAVSFSLELPAPVWTARTVGDPALTLYDVSLAGFVPSGEPGQPRLPRTGGWILVPPGTRPQLKTVGESWDAAGGRPLMVESVPVIIRGAETWENSASEILVLPGQEPPVDADIPPAALESLKARGRASGASAVTLGDVVWWRGRRIVSYQVVPVRHDGSGRANQVLKSGSWEIRFVPDAAAGREISRSHVRKSSTGGDDRFGGIFLNREMLNQLPAEAAWQGVDFSALTDPDKAGLADKQAGKAGALLGPETRFPVLKTGPLRVSYNHLRTYNLLPDVVIREDQVRLYQRRYLADLDDGSGNPPYIEIEVPIHMVGEGDNFDGDDFFVVYGLRLREDVSYEADFGGGLETVPGCGDNWEMNNPGNVYWLAASEPEAGQPWARMATITLPPASGTPLPDYRRSDHIEEQLAFRENLPTDEADRLYYNSYRAVVAKAGINPLWSPVPTGSDVELQVGLTGWNQVSRPIRLELVTESTLTTHLEDLDFATMDEETLSYTLPASVIDGQYAEVRMFHPRIPDFVYVFLNWVKISYDARYQATDNRLAFHGGDVLAPRPLEVTGFDSADLGLFEVTDPRNPVFVQLAGTNITTNDSVTWALSVMPDQTGGTRHFTALGDFTNVGTVEFPPFLPTVVDNPINPTDLSGLSPDMIVITHPEFRSALERWIEHRKNRAGGNLEVHVVEVDDLYNWYSGGLKDPWALKRFATHAITRWNSWALTVVGDANENVLEKGVLPTARSWSKDWVPTHYHVQRALAFSPELMSSDKWYATLESGTNYPEDDFPSDVYGPWEMYTGRFPCNSVAELDLMIDKVMTVDNVEAGQDWRRRGIFIADDQWSNGYGAAAADTLVYRGNETVFATSLADSLAPMWRRGSPVLLDSTLVLLETTLEADEAFPFDPPPPTPPPRDLSEVRSYTGAVATPLLIGKLNQGGLVAHYQGHANAYVLSSEYWMEDRNDGVGRLDVAQISNTDKPWVFMGLGCHIGDWAQNTVLTSTRPKERSISEKFLLRSRAGASATYASSGYEYITENRVFGEYIMRRWMRNPLTQRTVGNSATMRSRWVLGELMWASEADIFAVNPSRFVQEMVAQYVILGDPLMGLDAGEPVVAATLVGSPNQEISGQAEIFATDETNLRTVTIVARDEAGIDRIEVRDSQGSDLTGQVVTESLPPGQADQQEVYYTLQVPIDPYDHELTVGIWDTGGPLAGDRHYELALLMPQTAVFSTGGEVIDPATFVFPAQTPMSFSTQVTSAAWLLGYDPAVDFGLSSETLTLSDIAFNLAKNQQLSVDFTATSPTQNADDEHEVVLTIDGFPTELVLQAGTGTAIDATIGKVFNYPNPMRESTRFVFESGLPASSGTIRVFSVAGRPVARISFRFAGGGSGVVDWDGRDHAGDEMANGTYLYRVEMDTSGGLVVSDMQRLVMMR